MTSCTIGDLLGCSGGWSQHCEERRAQVLLPTSGIFTAPLSSGSWAGFHLFQPAVLQVFHIPVKARFMLGTSPLWHCSFLPGRVIMLTICALSLSYSCKFLSPALPSSKSAGVAACSLPLVRIGLGVWLPGEFIPW